MNDTVTQADQAALRSACRDAANGHDAAPAQGILCLEDFEEPARRFLPRPIFGFISGGVESNSARDGNRAAFREYDFLPRVLVNTRARHQKTTLFGRTYDLPFGFPPMGGTALAAYMGDTVLAKVAAELNTVMIQSGASLSPWRSCAPSARPRGSRPIFPASLRSSRRLSSGRSGRDSKCSC